MTREEAAKILYNEWQRFLEDNLDYAGISDAYKMGINALKQEPCEDAISRILKRMWNCRSKHTTSIDKVKMEQIIRDEFSPVTPQSKTGHWIRFKEFENGYYHIKCSECGQYWSVDGHAKIFRYCFNCGAKMEEVDF